MENIFLRKPYKTVDEFYKAVEQLIVALRAHGREAEASRLDMILHGAWITGSELIGELMIALADMKQDFPKEIRKLGDDCHYFARNHRRILRLG